MFADDELMSRMVLKGGNALDVVYGVGARASMDVDFSMEHQIPIDDLGRFEEKIRNSLERVFNDDGLVVFDVKMEEIPGHEHIHPDLADFWGGYAVEFKVQEQGRHKELLAKHGIEGARIDSMVVGPKQKRKFKIDISKFEFCQEKRKDQLEGYQIYV